MSARRWAASALVATVLLGAAGCARPDVDADRARALQSDVLAVTQASAEGRYDAAAALLDRLRAEVEGGRSSGDLSSERYATLSAAIDDVATELEAAASAQAAAEAAEQAAAAEAAAEAARAQATAEAAEQAAAAQAAADAALAQATAEAAAARKEAEANRAPEPGKGEPKTPPHAKKPGKP
ncbi:hypothetical protein OMK64_06125 [Cellulomonas fimi]|uniref:hypothetical protein n=1 Tax=Cellulomonas fimi TaxID=1708 RepID=UPI00234CDDF7|nr:hypothetical protein [Cellulomonas fimi]MDC7121110.1 hypothetical protein [Cellulomonas fimi]